MVATNIITPRRREDFFDNKGEPTLRFVSWIEAVTKQTNVSTLDIDSNEIKALYPPQTAELFEEAKSFKYPAIELQENKIRTITISVNYTASPNDFINALNNCQITFPKYPDENSVIIIRNGDSSTIKLDGNGKNMNGESTGSIRKEGTAIEFHYFIDTDEWFAR